MHTIEQNPFSLEYLLIEIQGVYLWHSGSQLIEMLFLKSRLQRLVGGEDAVAKLSGLRKAFLGETPAPRPVADLISSKVGGGRGNREIKHLKEKNREQDPN